MVGNNTSFPERPDLVEEGGGFNSIGSDYSRFIELDVD
jgi:hypothetical protein